MIYCPPHMLQIIQHACHARQAQPGAQHLQCGHKAQGLTHRTHFVGYHVEQRHWDAENCSLLNAEQLSCSHESLTQV